MLNWNIQTSRRIAILQNGQGLFLSPIIDVLVSSRIWNIYRALTGGALAQTHIGRLLAWPNGSHPTTDPLREQYPLQSSAADLQAGDVAFDGGHRTLQCAGCHNAA